MRIHDVLAVPTYTTGFTFPFGKRPDGSDHDTGVGEALSIGLVLDHGRVVWGDCMGVAHAGASGRATPFRSAQGQAAVDRWLRPALVGVPVGSFKGMAELVEGTVDEQGQPLPTAVRYGATQAVLAAAAAAASSTMAEVIANEYGTTLATTAVPLVAQTGEDWHGGAAKAIRRRLPALPHASVYDPRLLENDGAHLKDFIGWIKEGVAATGDASYRPAIHFDVYGTFGQYFADDLALIAGFMGRLADHAAPLGLQIECFTNQLTRAAQIDAFAGLRQRLRASGIPAVLIVDEWANTLPDIRAFVEAEAADMVQVKMPDVGGLNRTVEAVLLCHERGVAAYLGGSCLETDLSTRATCHVALATRPQQMLGKPGLSVDEAVMIMNNEMQRALAEIAIHARR